MDGQLHLKKRELPADPFSSSHDLPYLRLHFLDREDGEAVETLGTCPFPTRFAGAGDFHGVFLLPVGAVAVGVSRAHEHDRLRAEAGGEVDGAGVAAEDEGGAREDVRELLEARAPDEVDGRHFGECFDVAHEAFIEASAADEDGDNLLAVEPIGEHGEVFRRPALVRPVRADGENGEAARFVHALGGEQRVRRNGFSGGDGDGEAHILDAAAEGARDVEVALDDVPLGVRAPHGAAHIGGAFAHVHRAEAQLRARLRDDGSRLEEPLQIERRVVSARAKLMAEGMELFEEASHGAKALLLKKDDVVDAGIAREDVVGGRLDDPRQMRFGIRLLDRIGNGKRMDDVADGTELDDQDVFHSAPVLSDSVFLPFTFG